ncbi:MAG: LysR family transcriptional regulator [Bermanella sp.]
MYDDIVLFIHIAQQQGLAGAAHKLGVPAATVTRRLKRLEKSLGCQLIHRSARQFILTGEGKVFYQAYAELVEQLEDTQQKLSSNLHSLSGKLKVLAPSNISTGLLQPMWSNFVKTYPEIKLELTLSNSIEDMLSSNADIALRIGPQASSSLYQKRIGSLHTYLVCSPEYLINRGTPEDLESLSEHNLIGISALTSWNMRNTNTGKTQEFRPRFSTLVNDVKFVSQLVQDGTGIALLPTSEITSHIKSNKLVRILQPWQGPDRELFTIWPSGKLLNAKAKCLQSHIEIYMQAFMNNNDH